MFDPLLQSGGGEGGGQWNTGRDISVNGLTAPSEDETIVACKDINCHFKKT